MLGNGVNKVGSTESKEIVSSSVEHHEAPKKGKLNELYVKVSHALGIVNRHSQAVAIGVGGWLVNSAVAQSSAPTWSPPTHATSCTGGDCRDKDDYKVAAIWTSAVAVAVTVLFAVVAVYQCRRKCREDALKRNRLVLIESPHTTPTSDVISIASVVSNNYEELDSIVSHPVGIGRIASAEDKLTDIQLEHSLSPFKPVEKHIVKIGGMDRKPLSEEELEEQLKKINALRNRALPLPPSLNGVTVENIDFDAFGQLIPNELFAEEGGGEGSAEVKISPDTLSGAVSEESVFVEIPDDEHLVDFGVQTDIFGITLEDKLAVVSPDKHIAGRGAINREKGVVNRFTSTPALLDDDDSTVLDDERVDILDKESLLNSTGRKTWISTSSFK